MSFAPLTSLGTQGSYVIVMYIRDMQRWGRTRLSFCDAVESTAEKVNERTDQLRDNFFSFREFLIRKAGTLLRDRARCSLGNLTSLNRHRGEYKIVIVFLYGKYFII